MIDVTEESLLAKKTRELCETLTELPEFKEMRQRIDSFMDNAPARDRFQALSEKGEYLQHKQQQGVQLSEEEVATFEREREELFADPVARGFLDAQQEMHKIQESIGQYVAKTFELGRVPASEDLDSGNCGSSCGCAH